MKIDSYTMDLASSRVYDEKKQETEELKEWGKRKNQQTEGATNQEPNERPVNRDKVSLSAEATLAMSFTYEKKEMAVSETRFSQDSLDEDEQGLDVNLMTLKRMIESITGKEIKLTKVDSTAPETAAQTQTPTNTTDTTEQAPQEQEWGMSYTHYQSYYESEQTSFSAQGMVKTADGKEISFSVNLGMSREYFTEERLEIKAGAPLIDPLVINYAGNAAELEDMSFEFDLNVDGNNESIRQLKPGSGFLVFDRNKDGKVNDGSELFGPQTGDGFNELAAYDEDGNNWIDENDQIYTRLSVWNRDNGKDLLTSLKAANVGAIYLGNQDTTFDMKDSTNTLVAQVQKTGVYLKENGGAGTVQQIDFSA